MRGWMFFAVSSVLWSGQAYAQVSVPSVTTASPGAYANPLKLDTDRYKREQNAKRPTRQPAKCSADAMPAADKRRIEAEYARIAQTQGRTAAVNYARREGMRFRQKLVAQGVCPAAASAAKPVVAENTANTRDTSGKGKQKCTRTTMQARNIANPGGGAMSMIMVPVCLD